MAGFFKKLLGKKDEETTSQDSDGSWAEHEISVDINAAAADEAQTQEIPTESELPVVETQTIETQGEEGFVSKASDMQAERAKTGDTLEAPALDIAILNTADLKYAMDQVEPPKVVDPLDEITAQIQSELAEEKTAKEKKETLEKLLEVTNQLKRPDFDEDFDV